jgi:hypothetical protein
VKQKNENAHGRTPIKILLLGKDQKIGPEPEKILANLDKNGAEDTELEGDGFH